jgi:tryptophan 2,3-dioxygenase
LKENTKKMFLDHMKEYKSINIWFKQLPDGDQKNPELIKAMQIIRLILLVMQHLNVAIKYIEHRDVERRPDDWKKHMHLNTSEGYFFQIWN